MGLKSGGGGGTKIRLYNYGVNFSILEIPNPESRIFLLFSGVKFSLILSIALHLSIS